MRKLVFSLALVAATLSGAPPAWTEEGQPAAAEVEAVIERILELREEIEGLLGELSPEVRAEVERRWLGLREMEAGDAPPPGGSEPIVTGPLTAEPPTAEPPAAKPPAAEPPVEPPQIETPPTVQPAAPEFPAEENQEEPPVVWPPPKPPEPRVEEDEEPPAPAETAEEAEPSCGTLHPLDRNDDGLVDGSDRDWRYLYLRLDGRGIPAPGAIDRKEVTSLFDLGIRSLSVDLREFGGKGKSHGDIVVDQTVRLLLLGTHKGHDNGALVVDAGRLARSGQVRLVDTAGGEPLDGLQMFRPGVALELADGSRIPIPCP